MIAFLIVALGIIFAISLFSNWVFNNSVDLTMDFVLNNGAGPYYDRYVERFGLEAPYTIKYFTVTFNEGRQNIQLKSNSMRSVDYDTILEFTRKIMSGSKSGWIGEYKYEIIEGDFENTAVFINFDREIRTKDNLLQLTILAFIVIYGMLFFVMLKISKRAVKPISKRAVKPIEEGIMKQKTFISDASHEIKTPLAIISANNDVLELQYGENEWISSNRNQVRRLTKLINQMLTLTKYESDTVIAFSNINVKKTVERALEDYKLLFENEGIEIDTDLKELSSFSNEELLYQIISILFDNVIKYTNDEKKFKVSIINRELWIENTTDPIDKESLGNIFNRFYRIEKSRSREKGGNGIGLSLAQTIASRIEVNLSVRMVGDNIIRFIIKFNN